MRKKFYIKDINQIQDDSMANTSNLKFKMNELSQKQPQNFQNSNLNKAKCLLPQNTSQNHQNVSKKFTDSEENINNNYAKINQKWQGLIKLRNFTRRKKNKQLQQNRKTLQKLITKYKINNVVGTVANKLSRNLNRSLQKDQQPVQTIQQSFLDRNGLSLNIYQQVICTVISAVSFLLLMCLLSIYIIFQQPNEQQQTIFKMTIMFLLLFSIILNFAVIRKLEGKTICKIRQIGKIYVKQAFFQDLIVLLILVVDIFSTFYPLKYIRFLYLLRLRSFKKDVSKLDYIFINNFYKEQYWNLFCLVLGNFFLAHFFSLILLSMTDLSMIQQQNWLIKADLNTRPDFQKYIWSYYWSVTIMFTVGFGELTPANYKQAICIVFIQFVSSILLAYTISCVGELLLNKRNLNMQKRKNLKILKEIVQNNSVSRRVQEKVGNYIEQAILAKKQANFQEQKKFINDLPSDVKSDLVQQCNLKLFNQIPIIKNFATKIIQQLAQKIQLSISHPQQVLLHNQSSWSIHILKQGHVGYFASSTKLNFKYLMNQVKINSKQQAQIICLNFIQKQRINYEVKSITYSKVYSIQQEQFNNILKKNKKNFEEFLEHRDKAIVKIDQFQLLQCNLCKNGKHTKASCPKLHFIPYKNIVVYKHLEKQKNAINQRVKIQRNKLLNWEQKNDILNSLSNTQSHSINLQKNINNLVHVYKVYAQVKTNQNYYAATQQNITLEYIRQSNHSLFQNLISSLNKQQIEKTKQRMSNYLQRISYKQQNNRQSNTCSNTHSKKVLNYQECDFIKETQDCVQNNKQIIKEQNQQKMSVKNLKFSNRINARQGSIRPILKNYSQLYQKQQMMQFFINQYKQRNNIYNQDKNDIQCDKLFDFEYYFLQKNPKYLKNKPLNAKHFVKRTRKVAFMQVQLN